MVIDVLHIALVHAEHTEAGVQLRVRMLGLDFVARAANALLADLTDVLVPGFVGFAGLVTLFGKLHHDKLAMSAVLGVQLHDGMGSGGRAGEEIENDC